MAKADKAYPHPSKTMDGRVIHHDRLGQDLAKKKSTVTLYKRKA